MLSYHMLSEFQSGSSDLKHYNETISRVLVATCQVLPVKKTDQWDVWNKEPICGTCNWPEVVLEIEASVRQRHKGALFSLKNYKRVPLIWATPIFIAIYTAFDKTNFWKK